MSVDLRDKDPVPWFIAAVVAGLLLVASAVGPYGYFIDEFYYLACARHPAAGYVDHPPLAPLLLTVLRAIAGESLIVLRILPALAVGATVGITGMIARAWGGGPFAGRLAALGMAAMPVVFVVGSFYSMNAFELLVWTLGIWLVTHIVRSETDARRSWLMLGVLVGVGFELKHTIVVFVAGTLFGLVVTPARKRLSGRWPWIALVVAVAIAMPNLVWQIQHGFVSLEFYREATAKKNIPLSPFGVLAQQMLVLHPLLAPLWGSGAVALIAARRFRAERWVGVAWFALLATLMLSGASRPDRITGLSPALFAAGAIVWESFVKRRILRALSASYVVGAGLLLAPLNLPLLSFDTTARYAAFTHAVPKIERGKTSPLPQWLADRTGWEDFIGQVSGIVQQLPPDDRKHALLYASDYGHAGALELFGPRLSLPAVISPHNSYYHFSVGHTDSDILISVGGDENLLRELFRDVRQVGTVNCTYCMSWRSGRPIWIARGSVAPLGTRWASLKRYE